MFFISTTIHVQILTIFKCAMYNVSNFVAIKVVTQKAQKKPLQTIAFVVTFFGIKNLTFADIKCKKAVLFSFQHQE